MYSILTKRISQQSIVWTRLYAPTTSTRLLREYHVSRSVFVSNFSSINQNEELENARVNDTGDTNGPMSVSNPIYGDNLNERIIDDDSPTRLNSERTGVTEELETPELVSNPIYGDNLTSESREPAAASTNSGTSYQEMKQFGQNIYGSQGSSRSSSSTIRDPNDQSGTSNTPRRSFSKLSDQIKDAKEALKGAAKAARDKVSATVHETEAELHARNVKDAASDAYQSAKGTVSETVHEIKSEMNDATNNIGDRASQSARDIKKDARETVNKIQEAYDPDRTPDV